MPTWIAPRLAPPESTNATVPPRARGRSGRAGPSDSCLVADASGCRARVMVAAPLDPLASRAPAPLPARRRAPGAAADGGPLRGCDRAALVAGSHGRPREMADQVVAFRLVADSWHAE